MKSKIIVLTLMVLSFSISAKAQDQNLRNRTKELYNYGRIIIAQEPLPDEVYRAQYKKVAIIVELTGKNKPGDMTFPLTTTGTGFVAQVPGNIVVAAHVLHQPFLRAKSKGYDYKFDKNNFPVGIGYSYQITGVILNADGWFFFPLNLRAIERFGSERDIMALDIDANARFLALNPNILINGRIADNPYQLLIQPLELVENAKVGDEAYTSGYSADFYYDIIDFTFKSEIAALIDEMPVNRHGARLLYRMLGHAEPGFSGGPTFNKDGKVIGLTISMSFGYNFATAISSKDIKDFLKNHNIK